MIKRYTDHAANERTYLAWVRTAIAIMAFGFLVERFDLFIAYLGRATGDARHFAASRTAEYVGSGLLLASAGMIIGSTVRFFRHRRDIESEELRPYGAVGPNVTLAILMALLGIFLAFYLAYRTYV